MDHLIYFTQKAHLEMKETIREKHFTGTGSVGSILYAVCLKYCRSP